ncbi:MAG: hypothetical protein SP1CHLAM54_03940 [Chlamydiia bacterium]|nr:hypothetical protein [Chlamydiia bacterium]MCH9615309.1 hypothetical protein [Chlamydiia bacterium]MCH9628369.1 hypothetical protein [Chlamydiia bacterium]
MSVQVLSRHATDEITRQTAVSDRRIFQANADVLLTNDRIRQVVSYALAGVFGATGTLLLVAATYINLFTLVTPIAITLLVSAAAAAVFGYSIEDFQSNSNLNNIREEMHGVIERMQRVEDTRSDADNVGDSETLVTELRQTLGLWVERFGWRKMLSFGVPSPLHLRQLLVLMGKHLSLEEIIAALRGFKEAFEEIKRENPVTSEQPERRFFPYDCVPSVREFAHLWQPVSIQAARRYDLEELQALEIVTEREVERIRDLSERFDVVETTYLEETAEERAVLEQFIAGPRSRKESRIERAKLNYDNDPVHTQIAALRLREAEEIRRIHHDRDGDTRVAEHRRRVSSARAALAINPHSEEFRELVRFEEAVSVDANREIDQTFAAAELAITNRYKTERRRLIHMRSAALAAYQREESEAEAEYVAATHEDLRDFERQVREPKALYTRDIARLNHEFYQLTNIRSLRTR